MSVLVVAGRELRERRNRILQASVTVAVLPFLAALLPSARTSGRAAMIVLTGGILALTVALGTAAVMGASVVGRELSDKRLSFYFSRPISSAAIWWGKVIGALVAAFSAFALILGPSLLVGMNAWTKTWTMSPTYLGVATALGVVVLFLVSHTASTMIRSRSPLLAVDVLLAGVTAFALYLLVQPLIAGMAFKLLSWMLIALLASIVLVLAIAPMWQLQRGRTDRVRNHAALSLALWSGIGVIVAAAAVFVLWVVSASPADLDPDETEIAASPDGRTVMVGGKTKNRVDYNAAFILDENGSTPRSAGRAWWWSRTEFSRDSRVAAWLEFTNPLRASHGSELVVMRRGGKPERTGIPAGFAGPFVLSDDGGRVAMVVESTLSVHDVRRGVLLASVRIPSRRFIPIVQLYFMTPDRVCIVERYSSNNRDMEINSVRLDELDLRTRTLRTVVDMKGTSGHAGFSPDGRLMLMHRTGQVVEAETGRVLQTVENKGWSGLPVILDDGTVVMRRWEGEGLEFEISPPNAPSKIVSIPKGMMVIVGQVAPKKVVIVTGSAGAEPMTRGRRALAILDFERGAVTNMVEGISSVARGSTADPRLPRLDPTRIAALDADGKPVTVNVLTGERRSLLSEGGQS